MNLKALLLSFATLIAGVVVASADPDPSSDIHVRFGQANMESGGEMLSVLGCTAAEPN